METTLTCVDCGHLGCDTVYQRFGGMLVIMYNTTRHENPEDYK
jgi:hypothetical protein